MNPKSAEIGWRFVAVVVSMLCQQHVDLDDVLHYFNHTLNIDSMTLRPQAHHCEDALDQPSSELCGASPAAPVDLIIQLSLLSRAALQPSSSLQPSSWGGSERLCGLLISQFLSWRYIFVFLLRSQSRSAGMFLRGFERIVNAKQRAQSLFPSCSCSLFEHVY